MLSTVPSTFTLSIMTFMIYGLYLLLWIPYAGSPETFPKLAPKYPSSQYVLTILYTIFSVVLWVELEYTLILVYWLVEIVSVFPNKYVWNKL